MLIQVGTLTSKLIAADREERAWLIDYLSFEDQKSRYMKGGPKTQSLFQNNNDRFPSGLLRMVEKAGIAEGYKVELVDTRKPATPPDSGADLEWLFDYQREAVDAIVKKHNGILWLPTGAGKTEVIVGLTRAIPCFWLALVHRSQLADDIARRWEKRTPGLRAGRILEGDADIPDDATLVAATFQTIVSWLKKPVEDPMHELAKHVLYKAEGLLVDETHTLPADSFYAVAMKTPNAYYRVGLSGTPLARGDKKSMLALAALGPVVYRVKTQLLIDRGILARPTVRLATVTQLSKKATWAGVYDDCIVRGRNRNDTLLSIAARAAKPGFLFVQNIEHGKALTKSLINAGISAEFVWGSHSLVYRKSLMKRLVQGHFEVLVCSAVFQEGIDLPELRSVIIGAGGKSVIAALQRLGRGMRIERDKQGKVVEGSETFEVWDIDDRGNKWTEKHARERQRAYVGEGFKTYVESENATLPLPLKG